MTVAGWRPDFGFFVAFNADPNDPAAVPVWSDLTSRLRKANSVKRGRQYELDLNLAAQVNVTLDDPDEDLNPANTASPYYPNVVPYRQVLWQAVWPNPCAGNLLNTGVGSNPQLGTTSGYDPTFDGYAAGSPLGWITAVGGTSPVVTTTNPFQGAQDLTWTVAGGATVQGVSLVVPCMPGRQYTTSAYVRQTSASTQQISVVGGATGTSTTSTGTYVRLSVTFTATQPTHTIQIATTGTALAGTINLDALQHEQAATASAFTTVGSVIYGVFRGYVERWPSEWDHAGFRGRCEAILVDAFGPLNQIPLASEYRNSLLAKKPDYYWPLDEASTATFFGDASGNGGPALVSLTSKYGSSTPIVPGTALNIAGDPNGTGIQFTNTNTSTTFGNTGTIVANGVLNSAASPISYPPLSSTWSVSIAAWVSAAPVTIPGPSAQVVAWLATSGPGDILNPPIALSIGSDDKIDVTFGGATGSNDVFGVGPTITDQRPHLLVGTVTQTSGGNTVCTAYVDGVQVGTTTVTTASLGGVLTTPANGFMVGGFFAYTAYEQIVSGSVAHVALWSRVLTGAEVADLWTAGKGYTGESSGARITRYLGYGWTGAKSIDTGSSIMGVSGLTTSPTVTGATSTLTGCQDTTTSENGNLWVDADGNLTFAARSRRYNVLTSLYTFGENAAGGEYPYEEGIQFGLDATFAYNAVEVDNLGGISAIARDATTQKRFFPHGYQRNVNLASNNEATDAANWILSTHKTPIQRVASIALEPASKGLTLWPVVLGLELGQRVTVRRRAKAAGLTMAADYFVESIEHSDIDMDTGGWKSTLLLSPAFQSQVWILQDATYGVLGSTTILGY